MAEPVWIARQALELLHARSLQQFGGPAGLRDDGMLESALARPQHQYHYGRVDLAGLATAYAFGLARKHPFVDGNKRAAYLASVLFLRLNGLDLQAETTESVAAILALAAGELTEDELAGWIRRRMVERPLRG